MAQQAEQAQIDAGDLARESPRNDVLREQWLGASPTALAGMGSISEGVGRSAWDVDAIVGPRFATRSGQSIASARPCESC
jgi:hypothetical protein